VAVADKIHSKSVMSLANDKLMDEVWNYMVSPVGIVLYLVALTLCV